MSEIARTSSTRSMNSVLNTLRVLEEVAARQPIGVSDLARATLIPKSSVQRCLVTLQEAGWLRILDPEHSRWGVTMKALSIGLRGVREEDVRTLAAPVIKRLASETNETVILGLRDEDKFLVIAREDTTQPLRVILEIGLRLPLQATSAGVAIMAGLEPSEVDGLLKNELRQFADSPVLSSDEIRDEIARTVKRGYAINMSAWFRPQVASIGAAIKDSTGRPVAGLALSIPQSRYDPSRELALARMALTAADEISGLIARS